MERLLVVSALLFLLAVIGKAHGSPFLFPEPDCHPESEPTGYNYQPPDYQETLQGILRALQEIVYLTLRAAKEELGHLSSIWSPCEAGDGGDATQESPGGWEHGYPEHSTPGAGPWRWDLTIDPGNSSSSSSTTETTTNGKETSTTQNTTTIKESVGGWSQGYPEHSTAGIRPWDLTIDPGNTSSSSSSTETTMAAPWGLDRKIGGENTSLSSSPTRDTTQKSEQGYPEHSTVGLAATLDNKTGSGNTFFSSSSSTKTTTNGTRETITTQNTTVITFVQSVGVSGKTTSKAVESTSPVNVGEETTEFDKEETTTYSVTMTNEIEE